MKYFKPFILLLLFLSTILCAKEESNYNFRNTKWGMTREEVKLSEGKRKTIPSAQENMLVFIDTIADREFLLFYRFVDNKLARAGYNLIAIYPKSKEYIENYKTIKDLLIKKYGEPIKGKDYPEEIWSDETFKKDPQFWGDAVSMGHLVLHSFWETTKTKILLELTERENKVGTVLAIVYTSKELEYLLDKESKKAAKKTTREAKDKL